MKIWQESYGVTKAGKPVSKFFLQNETGTTAVIMDYGVTLLELHYGGKDVVLGYETLQDYEAGEIYVGATVGRFAGPIPYGKLTLNGVEYRLTQNDGPHHLHGGTTGFSRKVWDSCILEDGVRFSMCAAHGEDGYPGQLQVSVTCRLTETDGLQYIYDAVSDKDTVLNMTCHAYFNLEGHDSGTVLDHLAQSPAEFYRVEEPAGIPQPKLFGVKDTPFDFMTPHTFRQDLHTPHPQLDPRVGYDRNAYLGQSGVWKKAAWIQAPGSGITLEVTTTQAGLQFFCPGYILEDHPRGKGGAQYMPYCAFCMETQHCLSPQDAEKGQIYPVLPAGQHYHSETIYQLGGK